MTAYRLTEQADRNLGEIYLYAAEQFGLRQADKYAGELEHLFDLLSDQPLMGRSADRIRACDGMSVQSMWSSTARPV